MSKKSYRRVLILILLALFFTTLLSPWVAAFWNFVLDLRPQWEMPRYPFSRMFDRTFMIMGIILFFAFRRRLEINSASQLGLGPFQEGYPDLLRGFLLALVSFIVLGFAMSLAQVFTPYFRLSISEALQDFSKALLAALTVAFLEEIFFRGILFKGLVEDWRPAGAIVVTSLFYSAIHFVTPAEKIPLSGLHPLAGIRHLIQAFRPFLDLPPLLPGIFGLFLLGIVLCYAYHRSGSLYLSIGLHAGWVLGLKIIRIFGDYNVEDLGWFFGSSAPKIISGPASWIGILVIGAMVHWLTRERPNPLPK